MASNAIENDIAGSRLSRHYRFRTTRAEGPSGRVDLGIQISGAVVLVAFGELHSLSGGIQLGEHKIQWDLVGLFLAFCFGVWMMNALPKWWKRRSKKKAQGFQRMQPPAERHRHRGGKWGG